MKITIITEGLKIILTRRQNDYHACVEGRPKVWESGRSASEAVGNLIFTLREELGIEIRFKK